MGKGRLHRMMARKAASARGKGSQGVGSGASDTTRDGVEIYRVSPTKLMTFMRDVGVYERYYRAGAPQGSPPSDAQKVGDHVHEVLCAYVRDRMAAKRPPSRRSLREFYQAYLAKLPSPPLKALFSGQQVAAEISAMLEGIDLGFKVTHIPGVEMWIRAVCRFDVDGRPAEVRMGGFVDRAERVETPDGDALEIVDYKTTRYARAERLQLEMYAYMFHVHYHGEYDRFVLRHDFLRAGQVDRHPVRFDEAVRGRVEEALGRFVRHERAKRDRRADEMTDTEIWRVDREVEDLPPGFARQAGKERGM